MALTIRDWHPIGVPTTREIAEVSERLRQFRAAITDNQAEFAREAKLTQHRYNQYETGARWLTLDAAMKIRAAHGLSLDWVYSGDPYFMPPILRGKLLTQS